MRKKLILGVAVLSLSHAGARAALAENQDVRIMDCPTYDLMLGKLPKDGKATDASGLGVALREVNLYHGRTYGMSLYEAHLRKFGTAFDPKTFCKAPPVDCESYVGWKDQMLEGEVYLSEEDRKRAMERDHGTYSLHRYREARIEVEKMRAEALANGSPDPDTACRSTGMIPRMDLTASVGWQAQGSRSGPTAGVELRGLKPVSAVKEEWGKYAYQNSHFQVQGLSLKLDAGVTADSDAKNGGLTRLSIQSPRASVLRFRGDGYKSTQDRMAGRRENYADLTLGEVSYRYDRVDAIDRDYHSLRYSLGNLEAGGAYSLLGRGANFRLFVDPVGVEAYFSGKKTRGETGDRDSGAVGARLRAANAVDVGPFQLDTDVNAVLGFGTANSDVQGQTQRPAYSYTQLVGGVGASKIGGSPVGVRLTGAYEKQKKKLDDAGPETAKSAYQVTGVVTIVGN